MRKTIKTAIAALMLYGTALTPALAQNCTSPTRCDELGYKKSAADCDGMESLVCPFDNSKYFCVGAGDSAAGAQPGMILYSDGTVSYNFIQSKTPIGVVAYVDENRRSAISLREAHYAWSEDVYDVPCLPNLNYNTDGTSQAQSDFNGAANTQCLISDGRSYPAAEYCNRYTAALSGLGSSGWYLPAGGEIDSLRTTFGAINDGLQKASGMLLDIDHGYWSSSENKDSYVWGIYQSFDIFGPLDKDYRRYVRCYLAF